MTRKKGKKKRKKGAPEPRRTGLMTGMVGGFRRAVGVEPSKKGKRSWLDLAITIALAVAVAFFVVKRCGT